MAAGTAISIGLDVVPARERVSFPQRFLGTLLITMGLAVAFGVPLLLTGITGFRLWVGEGKSMEPTFYAGDFMVTRSVPAADLEMGDVVLFKNERNYVMHRIVAITGGAGGETLLTTRGDNNGANDPPMPAGAIEGKLVYDVSWLPRSPVDLSGTGIFVAEWLVAVTLITLGIVVKRNPARPRRVVRRVYGA